MRPVSQRRFRLADLTYPEVQDALERPNVAVLPVGATEQHGPHLPLDVDVRIAETLSEAAAERVPDDVAVVVAPALPFGISEHHMRFPGSIALPAETFIDVVYEVGRSLVRHGFERLVIVNGHGGNIGALSVVAAKLRTAARARHVLSIAEWALAGEAFSAIRDSPPGGTAHACEYETSLYLHLRPEMVQMEKAVREVPYVLVDGTLLDMFEPGPYEAAVGHDFSRSGVTGDPTLATEEKGRRVLDAAAANLAVVLEQVARLGAGTPPVRSASADVSSP